MRVLSLFSGGGLGDYGLELAGMTIVAQIEIDDYCQKILQLRWPDVPKWRDIREVKEEELPQCDLISGGFPCQDISIAQNDPDGIAGERSGLWKEQFRLIRTIRPRYALIENVAALLVRGLGSVLRDLASIGYDAEWQVISSAQVGSFHRRKRVWILAYPKSQRWEEVAFQGILNPEVLSSKPSQWQRILSYPTRNDYSIERWKEIEDLVCGDDDGDTRQVDRLHVLGNGQQVQVVEWIGRRILEADRAMREEAIS